MTENIVVTDEVIEQAKEARRAYHREWNRRNKEKRAAWNRQYWINKVSKQNKGQ